MGALRSRIEIDPHRNVWLSLSISSNELGSRLPMKPSFGPRGVCTFNVFSQKIRTLLSETTFIIQGDHSGTDTDRPPLDIKTKVTF